MKPVIFAMLIAVCAGSVSYADLYDPVILEYSKTIEVHSLGETKVICRTDGLKFERFFSGPALSRVCEYADIKFTHDIKDLKILRAKLREAVRGALERSLSPVAPRQRYTGYLKVREKMLPFVLKTVNDNGVMNGTVAAHDLVEFIDLNCNHWEPRLW